MATRSFDFSQLSAAERIRLAEELWDSVDPTDVTLSAAQADELDRRRESLRREGSHGRPWREALEDLRKRG
jgi:putative addiction module component (TIGR02574 family)